MLLIRFVFRSPSRDHLDVEKNLRMLLVICGPVAVGLLRRLAGDW